MQVQTLAELKAENAKTEEETAKEPVTDTVTDTEPEAEEPEVEAAEETTEETEQVAEPEQEDADADTVEAWMQEEEQASEPAKGTFTGSDIKAARLKERAKAEKRANKEIEELKAEIAALKNAGVQQAPTEATPRPRLEDFSYDEDAYNQALDSWYESKITAQVNTVQQKQITSSQQQQAKQKLEHAVDSHYERAQELIAKHGIDPEIYKQSEIDFRDAVEEIMPNRGDLVVDSLIATLGEGSEKVTYHLARNKAKLKAFQNKLAADPSGIQAAVYLGEQKNIVTMPVRTKGNAPKPATRQNGSSGKPANEAAYLKKYKKAHESGDVQAAFNAKREAKKAGINTRSW